MYSINKLLYVILYYDLSCIQRFWIHLDSWNVKKLNSVQRHRLVPQPTQSPIHCAAIIFPGGKASPMRPATHEHLPPS